MAKFFLIFYEHLQCIFSWRKLPLEESSMSSSTDLPLQRLIREIIACSLFYAPNRSCLGFTFTFLNFYVHYFSCLRKLHEKKILVFFFPVFHVLGNAGTMLVVVVVILLIFPSSSRGRAHEPCHDVVPSSQSLTGTFPTRVSLSMLLPFCEPICSMLAPGESC